MSSPEEWSKNEYTREEPSDLPPPENLSHLGTHSITWMDPRGIHIAFWDHDTFEAIEEGANLFDHMREARYIVSFNVLAAMSIANSLHTAAYRALRYGADPNFTVGAPLPFPSNTRERIWGALQADTGGDPDARMDMPPATLIAEIEDILKSTEFGGPSAPDGNPQ